MYLKNHTVKTKLHLFEVGGGVVISLKMHKVVVVNTLHTYTIIYLCKNCAAMELMTRLQ